jgi:hypothetical protein
MSAEDDARKVIDAAARLERGEAMADAKLEETEWSDQELLQEYGDMYGQIPEQATRIMQAQTRQRLRNIKADSAFMKVLKAEGVTPAQYVELEQRNPDAFPEVYQEGMVKLVKRVKGGPKRSADPFFAPDHEKMIKSPPQNVERAKRVAKQKKGDMDAVLNALMGFSDD